MLEPDRRELLLDALRPPDGYVLDRSVGTTYSLDLQALLLPPLAFAVLDWGSGTDAQPDVLAVLEAVRRNAERMTVFCQAGQIALPKEYRSLLVYLERCVVEVVPPEPTAIFHPKIWVLRYRRTDADSDAPGTVWRLVCSSRNLTFDPSWDTILVLEGRRAEQRHRTAARRRNRHLVTLLQRLPDLAVTPLDTRAAADVRAFAGAVSEVDFQSPDGFDDLAFHALGIGGRPPALTADADRVLVVSPFLTKGALTALTGDGRGHVLVSRQESLDAAGAGALHGFDDTFVLSPAGWQDLGRGDTTPPADTEHTSRSAAPTDEAVAEGVESQLGGLHAKLYVVQRRSDVRVFTGSANATDAALHGNVEFLVELSTRSWRTSIDQLLQHGDEAPRFRDLLQAYRPPHKPAEETVAQRLQRHLDRARRALGALDLTATLTSDGDGYVLDLAGEPRPDAVEVPDVDVVRCWPITLGAGHAVVPRVAPRQLAAQFGRVSPEAVTSFFAFELTARGDGMTETIRFATNARLVGAADDRRERVLLDMLPSRAEVLRYLLLLLLDGDRDAHLVAALLDVGEGQGGGSWRDGRQLPLFESMVRALAREPGRLDHIARLIDDLRASGRGDELLPEGLEAIWDPIWQARRELLA